MEDWFPSPQLPNPARSGTGGTGNRGRKGSDGGEVETNRDLCLLHAGMTLQRQQGSQNSSDPADLDRGREACSGKNFAVVTGREAGRAGPAGFVEPFADQADH